MANSVVARMLTGMVLSGSWICFEDAHKLPQLKLSILGDYLACVSQAYQCLMVNTSNQYMARGQSKADVGTSVLEVLSLRFTVPWIDGREYFAKKQNFR